MSRPSLVIVDGMAHVPRPMVRPTDVPTYDFDEISEAVKESRTRISQAIYDIAL